jgi:regulator of protease activity HflC (stomatin/prohibitin superfamily)
MDITDILSWAATVTMWIVVAIAVYVVLRMTFFTVKQQTVGVVQRFGKFARMARTGLNMKIPFIEVVAGRPNLRVQQLDVPVETKTKDNVFVKVVVSVQFFILETKAYEAFYKLQDPTKQITAYVLDVVRARVPKMQLDEVFETKDDIANDVKAQLSQIMDDFGYGILQAPVTDIDPDAKVKASMNEINAAQRMRVAATEKGEAEKIMRVKAAEGDAEAKELQGKGIAKQRKAIVEGLRESVVAFAQGTGVRPEEVMTLVLMTQFFDTQLGVAHASHTNTVFMPNTPDGLTDIRQQFIAAMAASGNGKPSDDVRTGVGHEETVKK